MSAATTHIRKENLHMNVAFCLRCRLLARLRLPFEEQLYALFSLNIFNLLTHADG